MSIHRRCKQLQRVADQMFMDFKYTSPGSREQLRALKTFNDQDLPWADFLAQEERRMSSTLAVKASVEFHLDQAIFSRSIPDTFKYSKKISFLFCTTCQFLAVSFESGAHGLLICAFTPVVHSRAHHMF